MQRRIFAALLGLTILGAGTARGEAFFVTGGHHYSGYSFYQNYTTPSLLHQTGGSTLAPYTIYSAIADFNGDGFPDVAVSNWMPGGFAGAGSVEVLDGKSWAHITTVQLNNMTSLHLGNGASVAAGDVNGDGIPDLIVGPNATTDPGANGSTQIRIFNGSNWSLLPKTYASNGDRVATADFNHDGKSDIITSGTVYDAASGNVLFNFPGAFSFAAGDVNGDGTPDIAVRNATAILVYSGIDQHVIDTVDLQSYGGLTFFTLADMNLDGYADFVINNAYVGVNILSGLDGSLLNTSTVYPLSPDFAGEIAAYVAGAPATAAVVPEPTTLIAMTLGSFALLTRRRRFPA